MAGSGGNTLAQLREMADKEKLSTQQALPLLMAAVADMYEAQQTGNSEIERMNENVIILQKSVDTNRADIVELKKRSNLWDGINSFLVVIGAAIVALLNGQK